MGNGILQDMITESEFDQMNQETSLDQMQDQIAALQEKINTVWNEYLTPISQQMSSYLVGTKMPQVGGLNITYGPTYNVSNVTDWIIDGTAGIVYQYLGVGWDNDPVILDYISRWVWGYDLIYKQPDLNGTYGLQAQIDQLNQARQVTLANHTKSQKTKEMFGPYV